jgi:hypothetical protein
MKPFSRILSLVFSTLILLSCEREITVDLPTPKDQIVVEGYIENGLPPYVFLTRNSPFFGGIDLNDLSAYFVRGAKIVVSEGDNQVELVEYSSDLINLLPEDEKKALADLFGISLDSTGLLPDFSIYSVPLSSTFVGEFGKKYDLYILADGKELRATTSIPFPVTFDSLWVEPHPNPENDTLVNLYGQIKDPDTTGNYYRYFTRRNSGPYVTGFTTVFDDIVINGKLFPIQIPYGVDRTDRDQEFDPNTFGYWKKGDTCYVRLSMLDRPHYEFWRTLENERNNQGSPFGSFTKVKTNIKGGLGIWGGYGSSINVYIPQE